MKRILSAVLCAVIVLSSLCITTPAAEAFVHFTDTSDITVLGADISYDAYLGAVKVETDGTANVYVDLDEASGYFAAWLPAAYELDNVTVTVFDFGEETDDGMIHGVDGAPAVLTAGHKFVSVPAGEEILLPEADKAYAVYFYGFGPDAEEIVAAANGSLNKFDEEYLDLSAYEVERYTKYFWENDIVFNESFFPIKEKDGSIAPISLMYDIDRVVSVKNSYLNKEYVYGRDYTVEDGNLILSPEAEGVIIYEYGRVFADTQKDSSYREMLKGGYAFCGQQMMYFTGYLNVTYTPANQWEGIVPESKGFLLPKTMEKLSTPGSTLKVLSIGDSLAGGANASISNGTLPNADIWRDMVPKRLQELYPDVNITYNTIAQGGATASLAIERMRELLNYAPDLLFIEFGTNECMMGDSAWKSGGYVDTVRQAIASVNENLPDCEIVLITPIISNPIFFPTDWFYAYADATYSLEREGVVVADATSLYQYIMSQKRYIDMTGDFLCHPSDFGTRIFVHTILKALEPATEESYIAGLSERVLNYRYENEFYPDEWAQIEALMAEGSAAVAAKTTADEARDEFLSYAARIDAIPTAEEIDNNASVDCETLLFNKSKTADLVDPELKVNCSTRYDDDLKVLVAAVTNNRKPNFVLDYTMGEKELEASDYEYAVVTCMEPSSNGSRAKASTVAFIVEGEELDAITVNHQKDDKYHSYVLDLTALEGLEGTITGVKIGVYASTSVGDVLNISSIVLCSGEENAYDIAIERERAANGDIASAVTYLMSDDETCTVISGESGNSYVSGDVDENGILNSKDLLGLRKYLALDEPLASLTAADADRDGTVGSSDVVLIRRTLAGLEEVRTVSESSALVEYDSVQQAAKVTFSDGNATLTADLEGAGYTADMFKYVTLCAKTADEEAMNVTVTVTTTDGTASDTLTIDEGEFFSADSAKLVTLTGEILSVSFTFGNTAGEVIYFDSFVLTPTVSAAQNAETVRVGAANLI